MGMLFMLVSTFSSVAALNIPHEKQEKEEQLTLKKRMNYLGKGLGYGLLSVGPLILALNISIPEVKDRWNRPDHVKKLNDLWKSRGKEPPAQVLAEAYDARSADQWGFVGYSSVPIGLVYLLYKNKIFQKSYENLKKAFQ